MTMELTDTGAGQVTVPGGAFDVRNFKMKETSADPGRPVASGEIAFSPKLGIAVKTHATVTTPTAIVANDSELIAVSP
jgi:hypothetical protein